MIPEANVQVIEDREEYPEESEKPKGQSKEKEKRKRKEKGKGKEKAKKFEVPLNWWRKASPKPNVIFLPR